MPRREGFGIRLAGRRLSRFLVGKKLEPHGMRNDPRPIRDFVAVTRCGLFKFLGKRRRWGRHGDFDAEESHRKIRGFGLSHEVVGYLLGLGSAPDVFATNRHPGSDTRRYLGAYAAGLFREDHGIPELARTMSELVGVGYERQGYVSRRPLLAIVASRNTRGPDVITHHRAVDGRSPCTCESVRRTRTRLSRA